MEAPLLTPADRLKELRQRRGYENATEAARAFGWNEVTYRAHESGGRNFPMNTAKRYALAFGSTGAYIMFGEEQKTDTVQSVTLVKLVGEVAAGAFRDSGWVPEDDAEVPAIPYKGVPASKQYAVKVSGPSVNKRIPDGMYAICALFDAFPGGAKLGSLVHVIRERGSQHEHTIKELRYTPQGMVLMPVSDDPEFQEPVPVENDEGDTVIKGVVIGVYQPM